MEFIFILLSWMILLVPGFDDSVPSTGDKIFKIETSPDIVESIKVQSDESFDFWGFDIVLKQNSTGILEIKIPKNLPTPASFSDSWYHDERAYALANGTEINYDAVEDPCYSHYRIPIEGKTNVEIIYSVIAAGTWKLYSPIQFDKDNPCYSKVFYEKPLDSPLKQFKSGIPNYKIQCKEGLKLLIRSSEGPSACVKGDTATELQTRWHKPNDILLEHYKDKPEVKAFYAKYDDVIVSVQDDHVLYVAGNEVDSRVRMNLYFDKNYEIDHIDLNCYVQKQHQTDVPEEFILRYLKEYDCKKYD